MQAYSGFNHLPHHRRVRKLNRTLKIGNTDWVIVLEDLQDEETVGNIVVKREDGRYFHATMIEDDVELPDGKNLHFAQLMIFEYGTGNVVLVLRKHPHTGRYMVQVEDENVFETEHTIKKIWRVKRSSPDNIAQAVKKTVNQSGWIYTNPRRIGSSPLKTHYVLAGWSPQLANEMVDIYDFVQSNDSIGLATLMKALPHMPERDAFEIFNQMRSAPPSED